MSYNPLLVILDCHEQIKWGISERSSLQRVLSCTGMISSFRPAESQDKNITFRRKSIYDIHVTPSLGILDWWINKL